MASRKRDIGRSNASKSHKRKIILKEEERKKNDVTSSKKICTNALQLFLRFNSPVEYSEINNSWSRHQVAINHKMVDES